MGEGFLNVLCGADHVVRLFREGLDKPNTDKCYGVV